MAVAGKLDAIGKATAQIIHEPHCIFSIAATDQISNNHFAISINRGPSPYVARINGSGLGGFDFLLLGIGE